GFGCSLRVNRAVTAQARSAITRPGTAALNGYPVGPGGRGMAGTRRLTVVTAFTVTALLFGGGSLRAFADHDGGGGGGGDRGGGGHDREQVQHNQPVQGQGEGQHGDNEDVSPHGQGNSSPVHANAPAAPQGGGGDRGGEDHRGGRRGGGAHGQT